MLATTLGVTMLGQLYLRIIRIFLVLPFSAAIVIDPDATDADRTSFGNKMFKCSVECMEHGLARHVRARMENADDFKNDPVIRALVEHTLDGTPCSNAPNEDRFARNSNYHVSHRGRVPDAATIIARHCLSEGTAWHAVAMKKYNAQS
jgi:hypothetical protein